uniref:Uncharacterized protein n=1 Tax=Leptospira santarosai serovar Arenal str. MAVJ 401 TaxID=1049976 RepID=M6JGX7_9LEPT|nr:hypothetical protein LEP1GSC063_3324 [Leptospira santarosai serovar Arenal str. MAVJ 401]
MKTIHEIIRRHGGKRGVEASPIRIEYVDLYSGKNQSGENKV